jgi:phospholipid transport system substrate-binding protein
MAFPSWSEDAADAPVAVINVTATNLQQALVGKQDYFAKNLPELYQMVDQVLVPSFDVEYAGKQVLGKKHWTAASKDQRDRFIAAFYDFLVKTYAKAVLEFDQRRMKVQPEPSYSKGRDKALVRTELQLKDGSRVLVAYALRDKPEGWRIYDVRVDGVSYVQNYRSQFDAEITALGIDTVIERLEAEAESIEVGKKTATEAEA